MNLLKKISVFAYLLVFCIYAISPITASVSIGSALEPISQDDPVSARLMLFEMLAGGSASQETALKSQADNDIDILLRKKRGLLPSRILLEAIINDSLVLDRPQAGHVPVYDAPKPSCYSSQHFFVSGVSPPSLS